MNLFSEALELIKSSKRAALCTVVEVSGSTPRKPGAKMIVIENEEPLGEIVGTIGGGAIEHLVRREAMVAIKSKEPRLVLASLGADLGMCCGGQMKVFIEPLSKKPSLICFGAGHINQALCPLALQLGYEVSIVDERKELLMKDAFKNATQCFDDTSPFAIQNMPFFADTFLVIATHDHQLDQRIVECVLKRPFLYGALVGSERKALMTRKRLLAKGFSEEIINRINCPAGIKINACTPEEIALSIAAQMTLVKHETFKNNGADRSRGQEHTPWVS